MAKANILVVEDEFEEAENIRETLEERGYSVVATVASGEEAIKKAEELRPDLVWMDIKLRDQMIGTEAGAKIHEVLDIPVVYVSAYYKDMIDFGLRFAIAKPIDWDLAMTTIEEALEKSRHRRGD